MRLSASSPCILPSSLALLILATTTSASLRRRQVCAAEYSLCAPTGALSTTVPPIGPELASLYSDLLASVKGVGGFAKREDAEEGSTGEGEDDADGEGDSEGDGEENDDGEGDNEGDNAGDGEESDDGEEEKRGLQKRDGVSMCCLTNTACLNLQTFNIPFCYDHFTTNFFLPTGAYGTLSNGAYTDPASSGTVNFLNGTFAHAIAAAGTTPSGTTTGLIYGPSPPPNPATLAIPSPFTSAGVGSALAASALGARVTYTTTLSGTTVLPTVIAAATLTDTAGVTTIPETTVSGTTISSMTTIVTSTVGDTSATAATTTTAAATTTVTSTGGAPGLARSLPTGAVGVGAVFGLAIVGMVGL